MPYFLGYGELALTQSCTGNVSVGWRCRHADGFFWLNIKHVEVFAMWACELLLLTCDSDAHIGRLSKICLCVAAEDEPTKKKKKKKAAVEEAPAAGPAVTEAEAPKKKKKKVVAAEEAPAAAVAEPSTDKKKKKKKKESA